MIQRIMPRWKAKEAPVRAAFIDKQAEAAAEKDRSVRAFQLGRLINKRGRVLDETIVEIIISGAQNEVRDLKKCLSGHFFPPPNCRRSPSAKAEICKQSTNTN